jgi:MinD superfamily P-loop ATPase
MVRVAELASHFNIPAMVCINKYDLNLEQTQKIETHAREKNITVVGKISFDPAFTEAMIQAKTIFEYNNDSQAAAETRQVWDTIVTMPAFNAPVNNILQHL